MYMYMHCALCTMHVLCSSVKIDILLPQEQLAEGLHMIDFEQLKINNVDLNEKIEERNEDILKLRKKVTATVEVLTHVKEKLQFLQAENLEKKAQLRALEEVVAKVRGGVLLFWELLHVHVHL